MKGKSLNGMPSNLHSIRIRHAIAKNRSQKNIDLIVMGRHGYGALKDALMGGVARGVLRHSYKPVLLVKLPED
jgi:nucleotide-binding universal stress UspA family protein